MKSAIALVFIAQSILQLASPPIAQATECCYGTCWANGCCEPNPPECADRPPDPIPLPTPTPPHHSCRRGEIGSATYSYTIRWAGDDPFDAALALARKQSDEQAAKRCGGPARRIGDFVETHQSQVGRQVTITIAAPYCCSE